ncbi:MAG TPA: polysaccharide deacetylase family protein [Gaiellaceae bacterium]|nr:polysaccharide deacetylase family protein [Gaiellaceae bacterium]
MPRSTVCLTFDFDALSVWLAYDRVTPAMLHRGEYGARVGVPRVLALLAELDLAATFFVPGHTVESFPEETASILEAGHEIAHHSYAHVDPPNMTPAEERADMERAWEALARAGVTPLGFRAPSAELSEATLSLVEELGFLYDSSLMTDDYRPFRPRIGGPGRARRAARPGLRRLLLGAAAQLRARRLGALPVQLRPWSEPFDSRRRAVLRGTPPSDSGSADGSTASGRRYGSKCTRPSSSRWSSTRSNVSASARRRASIPSAASASILPATACRIASSRAASSARSLTSSTSAAPGVARARTRARPLGW